MPSVIASGPSHGLTFPTHYLTPPYPISLSRPHFPPQRAAHHVLALHVLPTIPNFFLRSVDACTAASALIRWPRPRPPVLFGQVRPDWPAGSDHGDWAARPVAGRTGLGTLVLSLIRNDRVLRGHVCVSIGDGADIEVEMQRIGDLGPGEGRGRIRGVHVQGQARGLLRLDGGDHLHLPHVAGELHVIIDASYSEAMSLLGRS